MKLAVMTALAAVADAKLVSLDITNFDETVAKGNVLVKFFAPWCGHCKRMAPGYKKAAEDLASAETKAIVAELDCDNKENKPLMAKYGVKGFPTLIWFDQDGNHHPYTSGRDEASVKAWVVSYSAPPQWYTPYMLKAKGMVHNGLKEANSFGIKALRWSKTNLYDNLPTIYVDKPDDSADFGNTELLRLTPENLESTLERKNVLVKFFAPWCGHCKKMAPEYEKVATAIHKEFKHVTIAEFDCTQDGAKDLGKKYAPRGYPTVLYFPASGSQISYNQARDAATMAKFVRRHAAGTTLGTFVADKFITYGKKAFSASSAVFSQGMQKFEEIKAQIMNEKPAIQGNKDNFAGIVEKKNALVKFYAPWCGHCKKMAPAYSSAAKKLHEQFPSVQIVKFDCTADGNKAECSKYGVKGFPTIKWFDASGETIDYNGGRDEASLIKWVSNKMDSNKADQKPESTEDKKEL